MKIDEARDEELLAINESHKLVLNDEKAFNGRLSLVLGSITLFSILFADVLAKSKLVKLACNLFFESTCIVYSFLISCVK